MVDISRRTIEIQLSPFEKPVSSVLASRYCVTIQSALPCHQERLVSASKIRVSDVGLLDHPGTVNNGPNRHKMNMFEEMFTLPHQHETPYALGSGGVIGSSQTFQQKKATESIPSSPAWFAIFLSDR